MGVHNYGSQTIVFKYKNPSTSKSFNNLLHNILPVGIYKGGTLTIVSNTTVRCSVLSVFIADDIEKVAVKCETSKEFDLPITTVQNYIILRLDWISSENNFIDAINVSEGELRDTDIILGRGVYDGITLISIDTSVRTIPRSVIDSVDSPQIKESAVIDSKIGIRVLNQETEVPYSNSGLFSNFISWFGKRIKEILGTTNWYDTVPVNLTDTKSHIDATINIHGATSENTPNRVVIRDNNGDFSARNITANRLIGTADTLTNERTIELSGDVSGQADFDGSNNINIGVTVADNSHNHTAGNITGLDNSHSHTADNITGLDNSHKHTASNITNLDNSHKHTASNITNLDNSHNHTSGNITGLESTVKNMIYPVGSFYVQYPNADSNDVNTAFPVTQRPASMFGGTWEAQWETESIFFRTHGTLSDASRTNGFQDWNLPRITGNFITQLSESANRVDGYLFTATSGVAGNAGTPGGEIDQQITFDTNAYFGKSSTDVVPRNRRIRVWKRIA